MRSIPDSVVFVKAACRKRFPNPEEPHFLQLAKAPSCEQLMIAAKAQSLRWLVAARRLSQREADKRLWRFRVRLEQRIPCRRVRARKPAKAATQAALERAR